MRVEIVKKCVPYPSQRRIATTLSFIISKKEKESFWEQWLFLKILYSHLNIADFDGNLEKNNDDEIVLEKNTYKPFPTLYYFVRLVFFNLSIWITFIPPHSRCSPTRPGA